MAERDLIAEILAQCIRDMDLALTLRPVPPGARAPKSKKARDAELLACGRSAFQFMTASQVCRAYCEMLDIQWPALAAVVRGRYGGFFCDSNQGSH